MKHEPVKDHAERKRISALIERCGKEQTMSDSTRIEKLREEVGKLCGNCDRPDKEQLGEIILSSMALGFSVGLKAPSADRPQGWIPCSERLPEENGDYLVTLENGVVKILGYSTTQRTTYPKGFYHIEDGFSWRQVQNPVIAWMPLPKPWKGADDETD